MTREPVFSPGKVEDDRAILEMTAARLRELGHTVDMCNAADDTWPEPDRDTVVFTMAQGAEALRRLQGWEARGVRVVNRTAGILNCQRQRTVAAFAGRTEIAFPDTVVLPADPASSLPAWIDDGGAWVKRGDVHATEIDDVVYVRSAAEATVALRRFRARGIALAAVQRHVPGRVLKFYAVRDRFFECVVPAGGEDLPGDRLRRIDTLGRQAAIVLDVEVYGGDCVVGTDGGVTLIDLNDWPSYGRCRFRASRGIADYLLAQRTVATDL